MSVSEIILNVLVYMNIYGYYILPAFAFGLYYIIVTIFSFPLITRKSHEFVIMATVESVKVKKLINRELPFFKFKNGLYWFANPCKDIESFNQFHLYIEGINQPIVQMERRDSKVHDLTNHLHDVKQLGNHVIRLPRNFNLHLNRHFMLIVDPVTKLVELRPTKTRQALRVSFYHTLGIVMQKVVLTDVPQIQTEVEQENANVETITENVGNQQVQMLSLTSQTILHEIKYVQEYSNYSSSSAFKIWKQTKSVLRNWSWMVKGSIDPRILLALTILGGGVALIILFMQMYKPDLGPMPT